MSAFYIVLSTVLGSFYFFLGALLATIDIANGGVPTPQDLYNDGYNWFGSWLLFTLRVIIAFPFYIVETLLLITYKFGKWLLTVRKDDN